MKRIISKTDALLIACLLLATLLFFAWKNSGAPAQTATIICGEAQTQTSIDLSDVTAPYNMTLENGIVLHIEKGSIAVLDSPCADKLCIHCGTLTKDGDTAVCLPQRTIVRVSGEKPKNAPDIITY